MNKLATIIGGRIKLLRKEQGLTQEELAEQLNVKFDLSINKSMISKWENDKSDPYLEYAKNIADFFNVDLDYLVGLTDVRAVEGVWKIEFNNKDDFLYYNELFSYCKTLSAASRGKVVERARVLCEFENEETVDVEVPEEYSGPDAELFKRIRDEDVETTLKDLVNRGTAEMIKRDALDIKNKAK